MITPPSPPLLRRLPAGVWVGLCWLTLIVFRYFTRPHELECLLRLDGNPEDAPLLDTALVTTLGALLLVRAPLAALAVALAGSVGSLGMAVGGTPIVEFLLADLVVAYVTATRERWVSLVAVAMPEAVLLAYTGYRITHGYPEKIATFGAMSTTVAVAWLVGNTVRQGRLHTNALRSQATDAAVTEERLRIARELHDMVAHSIGVIAIQAGVGSRVMATQPEETRKALQAIEATSRQTLAGLRRMLGALREDSAALAPMPGLGDLERLAADTSAAGVRVSLRRTGSQVDLPGELDLSVYRIVQEALTNVLKHSGATACTVTVDQGERELSVEIVDAGRGAASVGGGGFGLTGMRERVSLLGGEFSAGPGPDGGFRVAARLPVQVTA